MLSQQPKCKLMSVEYVSIIEKNFIHSKIKTMDSLFTHWAALGIGIGSFIGAIWLWSGIGDWCHEYWTFMCKAAMIDGPPALPIIGNGLYFMGNNDELLNKWTTLAKTYTTSLRVWLGPRLVVIISAPSDIEILTKSPNGTSKSSEYRFVENATGPGLITTSGPTYKLHRNLIMPLVNGKVLDEFIDSFEIQSRRCVECLERHVDSEEFDVMPFLDNWSVDIVLDTIVGVPSTIQQGGNTELMESIITLNSLVHERLMKVWLHPDWIYSRTGSGRKHSKAVTFARKFMDEIIAEKKKKYYDSKNSLDSSGLNQSVVLDQLIAYNEEHKLMDDIRLRDEVFTIVIGAHDPPALVSSFMLLMLAMHPEIQDKVRAEVRDIIGDENVTAKSLAQLKYLEMVIKETVRLFPAGVFLMREITDDIKFSSCVAPKGCTVAMFPYMTYRDPKLWKEPNKFDPDRFLPENSVGRHSHVFIPFSSGVRRCIGKQYGTMMIKILVARIVQKYRLHSNGSLEKLRLAANLFIRSVDGYKVSITRL